MLERDASKGGIPGAVWLPDDTAKKLTCEQPFIGATLKVWYRTRFRLSGHATLLPFEKTCSKGEGLHRGISVLYTLLQQADAVPPMKFLVQWEEALHTTYTPPKWDKMALCKSLSS
ncbi:Hypothetical predicted protein [Pelobates cultripes]|uniref:Uncharacterized protein n=1 Tax=Pelobates cultripes TaxID=61616 RepID=A0AAD1W6A7_PELCU|nr:Hypothetical predicted protein [Pelobates cultripes]